MKKKKKKMKIKMKLKMKMKMKMINSVMMNYPIIILKRKTI